MGIKKVLVANRGEIARRIFRTCRDLGIATVAVHSDPDSQEPHSVEADESVNLRGATPTETYLNIEAILEAAKATGADAVHPGYGFLSENAGFAAAVAEAGHTWIGPGPEAIAVMGSKIDSKNLVAEAGVPTLPTIELAGLSTVRSAALAMGYPVLVKASGGGGGKGMRVVREPYDLRDAIDSAKREASSAFGDDRVFLEKYLEAARHVEIQIFADTHGNTVSLFERECSIQRRHQKIIEESPSPALDDRQRRRMGKAATNVAEAVGYIGAGTVEFLVDDQDFFFLEMNTRLQVEHPVTELVTGLDLVELQLKVAEGDPLPESALVPSMTGHAIEARLYAEDPANGFLPVTGAIHRFQFLETADVRVDSGVERSSEITVHYDPMMAKVISHASSREAAAAKLAAALRSARIHGPANNIPLLVRILESDEFLAGETYTNFLEREDLENLVAPLLTETDEERVAMATAVADQSQRRRSAKVLHTIPSGWRNLSSSGQRARYAGYHGEHEVVYQVQDDVATFDGHPDLTATEIAPTGARLGIGDDSTDYEISRYGHVRFVNTSIGQASLTMLPRFPEVSVDEDPGSLHAPMPGKVLRVDVSVGETVEEGQTLLVMEAMKMEHTLKAPHNGGVTELNCGVGDQVEGGAVLVVVSS